MLIIMVVTAMDDIISQQLQEMCHIGSSLLL